ncbi:MAG: DnaB-like helicase C-terminal domain-containing protein, partial [Microbacteriaceae bacterium]|nr:DnaB-like helicase C-terminal domain-containing protein [Microbacteriaceae bacterium]
PGMGKTSFVLGNMLHAAMQGRPAAMFSLEMSTTQLFQRLIAMKTNISSNRLRRGDVGQLEFTEIGEAVQNLSGLPIYIDDTPGINIFELRAKARRLVMQHNVQLLIVDYLQLMTGDSGNNRGGNREQEISGISRGLKALAKELNVPVIALSQLSRSVETRGGAKRPQLSDLRESGAIEQDADIVGFLYRPEYYDILEDENGASTKGRAELLIEKHRNGALETIGMRFDGPTTSFSDISSFTPDTQFPSTSGQSISINRPSAVEEEDVPF